MKTLLLPAATDTSDIVQTLDFDWPKSFEAWLGWTVLGVVLVAWVGWWYVRDTRSLPKVATAWMLLLRLAVLAAIAAIALNPHYRTTKELYKPSRVAVLVDTSLSMDFSESIPTSGASTAPQRTRYEAVLELLRNSPVIDKLREHHQVAVYTFDHKLEGPHRVFQAKNDPNVLEAEGGSREEASGGEAREGEARPGEGAESSNSLNWAALLEPRGHDTRLGGALLDLLKQFSGETVSGIIVVTDGASNAGIDPRAANADAKKRNVRLVTVGVGSTQPQPNLEVAQVNAPTHVAVGDPYEIKAHVQGRGLTGQSVIVELKRKPDAAADDVAPTIVATRTIRLAADGEFEEVSFEQSPTDPEKIRFYVEAR
ncbi:MAG: VWA domain-containing protein, partial [Planctomycetes bacterium]|nr:VWA domain-containing protein [Planctomycetota bacterium]